MGRNNQQRRAAKKRERRADERRAQVPYAAAGWRQPSAADPLDQVRHRVAQALTMVTDSAATPEDAARLMRAEPRDVSVAAVETFEQILRTCVDAVIDCGWLPTDLAAIAVRPQTSMDTRALAALLTERMRRHPVGSVPRAWRDDLARIGPPEQLDLRATADLAIGLRLYAVLIHLPGIPVLIEPPGSASPGAYDGGGAAGIDPQILAKVRALLAKAESTDYPAEAEALSAKAQQLISRYSLEGISLHADDDAPEIVSARFWIDAPYVAAKGVLLNAVARANRCRTVISESIGFSVIVGTRSDIEAVELLTTSLLIQASAAMARHGAQSDRFGRSRTRSFRQSFLVSYATRIGERLHEADSAEVDATGRAGELVPVLARHEAHVDDALTALFPATVKRASSVTNREGWAAGRAAADMARLNGREGIAMDAS